MGWPEWSRTTKPNRLCGGGGRGQNKSGSTRGRNSRRTADTTVPFENAERFTRLMTAAGNLCVLVPFEGKGHGFFNGKLSRPSSDGVDYNLTVLRTIEFLTARGYIAAKR